MALDHRVRRGERRAQVLKEEISCLGKLTRAVFGGDLSFVLIDDVEQRKGYRFTVVALRGRVKRDDEFERQFGETQEVAGLAEK